MVSAMLVCVALTVFISVWSALATWRLSQRVAALHKTVDGLLGSVIDIVGLSKDAAVIMETFKTALKTHKHHSRAPR